MFKFHNYCHDIKMCKLFIIYYSIYSWVSTLKLKLRICQITNKAIIKQLNKKKNNNNLIRHVRSIKYKK